MCSEMRKLTRGIALLASVILVGCGSNERDNRHLDNTTDDSQNTALAYLGEQLFHDVNLSLIRTMSCATCHNSQHAFVDDRENIFLRSVSMGADEIKFGTRNTPTVTYAMFSPNFSYDSDNNEWVGGQFHDGRAQHLTAQVNLNGGPILNPVEMMMPDRQSVVSRLLEDATYTDQFQSLFGSDIFDRQGNGGGNPAFSRIGQAIAAFEMTDDINSFDSRFDRSLTGDYTLSPTEARGWQLVQANCMACHDSSSVTGVDRQTFTNYRYYNLGVPVNQAVRDALGSDEKDPGLFGNPNVNDPAQLGKFKTPSLRNIAVTGPYMHNGIFASLETVLQFKDYRHAANNHERVINPETNIAWGDTDYPETVQYTGADPISDEDIRDIIAFLSLLTDHRYESLLDE